MLLSSLISSKRISNLVDWALTSNGNFLAAPSEPLKEHKFNVAKVLAVVPSRQILLKTFEKKCVLLASNRGL